MKFKSQDIQTYYEALPQDRKVPFEKLFRIFETHLPSGFESRLSYGFPTFSVPLSTYGAGYHCKTDEPLPFLSIGSQKNFMAVYHMGLYASPELLAWFTTEYPKHSKYKLDMGKSCIRFKKMDAIPYELLEELAEKMTAQQWIELYERSFLKQ
ncbi:DUF1801 domain-containing protein [Chryseobacterium sp. A301]